MLTDASGIGPGSAPRDLPSTCAGGQDDVSSQANSLKQIKVLLNIGTLLHVGALFNTGALSNIGALFSMGRRPSWVSA